MVQNIQFAISRANSQIFSILKTVVLMFVPTNAWLLEVEITPLFLQRTKIALNTRVAKTLRGKLPI